MNLTLKRGITDVLFFIRGKRLHLAGGALMTLCFLYFVEIPGLVSSQTAFTVEPGYTQGNVVSGAIFHGRPFRTFPGKRVFTKGWEHRVGKKPLDWETIETKYLNKGKTRRKSSPSSNNCTKWSVVTTIFAPTEAIHDAANMGDDWCIVIVGDKKTPADFLTADPLLKDNDSVFFVDADEQQVWSQLPGELGIFADSLPYNHFARKNLGFIYAILRGAKFIYDFDDDNYVKKDAKQKSVKLIPNEDEVENVRILEVTTKAFNHHPLMGATLDTSWARGFPLEHIQDSATHGKVISTKNIPMDQVGVIQYCADTNPDIDAVHRLSKPLPMDFIAESAGSSPLLVPSTTAAPYNAQATIHHAPALFATLLPITVKSRVSDIWRSYYANPLFRDIGVGLLFAPPRIHQIRNVHSFIGDMKAEGDLYFKSNVLTQFLSEWKSSEPSLPARMEQLWIDLYERGYHEAGDVYLAQNWLAALIQIRYDFATPR